MGYFATATEGDDYEQRFCVHCVHYAGDGCAVWLAHMLHNYDDCEKPDSILHLLIPRSLDGLGNLQCRLFVEKKS